MEDDFVTTFRDFGRNQAKIKTLLYDVKKTYTDLSEIRLTAKLNIEQLFLSTEEERKVRQSLQEPKLVFTGQTNAGKSSLINELLGATVLNVDDTPCTTRITELAYGDNEMPIVEIRTADGQTVIKTETLTTPYLPSGIVNLPEEERDNEALTRTIVCAKMKNAVLRGGVRIVDSPGGGENQTLDRLIEAHRRSVLPLVVYVIDGKDMLGAQAIADIKELYRTIPSGNVFFAVTKCDDPDRMGSNRGVQSDSESDSEDQPDDDRPPEPTGLEKEIREGIYRKLVAEGFLKRNVPIEGCRYYHTLSSRYVKKYRLASQRSIQNDETRRTLRECERFMVNFRNFKASLVTFIREQLDQTVLKSTESIRLSLVKYLDYFVGDFNRAKEESVSNEQNIEEWGKKLQDMKIFRGEEVYLWDKINSMVQGAKREYTEAAEEIVNDEHEEILELAKEMRVAAFEVPSSGYVARDVLSSRAAQLTDKVVNKIGNMIHDKVKSKNQVMSRLFDDISDLVEKLQARMADTFAEHDVIRLMLINQYKLDREEVIIKRSLFRRAVDYLKNKIKSFFSSKVEYDHDTWCESVVKRLLQIIDIDKLVDAVMAGTLTHLTEAHDGLCKQMEALLEIIETHLEAFRDNTHDLKFGEELRRSTPRMGRLLLMAWDIEDRLRFGRLNHGQTLGGGSSRGTVYECNAEGPHGELCAVKVIRLENLEEVGEVGLRLHCYRKLANKCEYLAEVFAVQSEWIRGNVYELSILMPRLERNLMRTLPGLHSLRDRLLIALQVSKALVCIHKEYMTYGNISCTNVLLYADNRVRITDYIDPMIGLPIYYAPEISRQLRTTKVDVYAFGILLWCICKGEGIGSESRNTTGSHRRLERIPGMRDDCWALIDICLSTEPNARPTMEAVTSELIAITDDVRR